MSNVDMGNFIAPKSDQLNADDLIAAARTITVTSVRANDGSGEQPISINFEGDGGKPYKPCKSMRRVMVCVWGANAAAYVGRSMTLYRDESVQFGGTKVGGIRISHMSHIDAPQTLALTATRAKRAPFTVQPLQREATAASKPAAADAPPPYPTVAEYIACRDGATFEQLERRRSEHWKKTPTDVKAQLKAASDDAAARIRLANAAGLKLDTEADAIAALEAAFKTGRPELAATWIAIENSYASRKEPIPLPVDAKYSELNEALKE